MSPNENQSLGASPEPAQPASAPQPDASANSASQPNANDAQSASGQGIRDALSIIGVLLAALFLAWGLISFVFQSYQVDGPSMQTTLQNNDHLVVWKVPRTWSRITGHQYVPNRGDVIVFNEPGLAEFGQGTTKQLIKRVIGLPGERVVVSNGQVTIYNKANPNGFDPDKTLAYGKVIPTTSGNIDITLGPKQIFVCGDNRPDSLDSRVFGPVSTKNIVGKLVIRVLPINEVKFF